MLGSDNSVQQTVKRELPPVALKIGTDALVEKQVRFQDQEFHEQQATILAVTVKKLLHDRKNTNFSPNDFLSNSEIDVLYQVYEELFWWRPGLYSLYFSIRYPNGASLVKQNYVFTLGHDDVRRLKSNLDVVKVETRNGMVSAQDGFEAEPVIWHRCDPKMKRLL